MIRHAVNAAFLLRDGFSGRTLTDGSATRCFLDGRPLSRPLWKREGYLVLTDLAPGEHQLRISRRGYREETVTILAEDGKPMEDTITLKPGAGYRFPQETVRVTLQLRRGREAVSGEKLWMGVAPRVQLRLAQDKTEIGAEEAHLFCEGSAALLPIPGHFLMADKKGPELVYLRSLRGETGQFLPTLTAEHSRGTQLIPMQSYETDGEGNVQVLLREPGTLTGYFEGKVFEAQLQAGEQTVEWKAED